MLEISKTLLSKSSTPSEAKRDCRALLSGPECDRGTILHREMLHERRALRHVHLLVVVGKIFLGSWQRPWETTDVGCREMHRTRAGKEQDCSVCSFSGHGKTEDWHFQLGIASSCVCCPPAHMHTLASEPLQQEMSHF